jgi:putative membrane protein
MLTAAEQERVAEAVREAEARSSGEIVVVVAEQADGYRTVPFLYALTIALLVPWPLIWITRLNAEWIFAVQLTTALSLAILLSLPRRRYGLVPGFVKRRRARAAAQREFLARGLTRTRARTGVLIYVAGAEQAAEIIPDTGVADRVEPSTWADAQTRLVAAVRAGRTAEGLAQAVTAIGTILAAHAPPRPDDIDEVPNKVVMI